MQEAEKAAQILADNIAKLMRARDLKNVNQLWNAMVDWGKRTRRDVPSKNTLSNALRKSNSSQLDTIALIAAFFSVEIGVLLTENLPTDDPLIPGQLHAIAKAFCSADEKGRKALISVATSVDNSPKTQAA